MLSSEVGSRNKYLLNKIHNNGLIDNEAMHLDMLNLKNTIDLLANSLQTTSSSVSNIAQLVHHKTQGNPFFIKRLLQ